MLYIVEKETKSGEWVRLTPRWAKADCEQWVAEAREKLGNRCADLRVRQVA